MVYVNSKKFACESCIKGHRSSSCHHTDVRYSKSRRKDVLFLNAPSVASSVNLRNSTRNAPVIIDWRRASCATFSVVFEFEK
ncbi:hypothetical protein BJ912DRAFT_210540 [Pholiota molesta]|nr:hypothetical protein BJ912DRAFT_210540 [Pholiota molesta]